MPAQARAQAGDERAAAWAARVATLLHAQGEGRAKSLAAAESGSPALWSRAWAAPWVQVG